VTGQGLLVIGRVLADLDCRERDGERGAVGKHMRGVGQNATLSKTKHRPARQSGAP